MIAVPPVETVEAFSIDRILAVAATVVSIPAITRGALGSGGRLSLKRVAALLFGGLWALIGLVGLLVVCSMLLEGRTTNAPTGLGGTLAIFGGMLGVATLLAGRYPGGMTEDTAVRNATQALAMALYVALPELALVGLGLTRLLRACLPFTIAEARWAQLVEGLALVALASVPRSDDLGGLRTTWSVGLG